MSPQPIHNRIYLKDRRQVLRNNLTSAEAVLWTLIKGKQLDGRKFRRQHSIENYIVDFYCPAEKLVIELDGSVHDNPGQANADYIRDEYLKASGFKILRIENQAVFDQPETVLDNIKTLFS